MVSKRKASEIYGNRLSIWLGEQRIGTLTADQYDGSRLSFELDYVEDRNRPVLSLNFQSKTGGVIESSKIYRTKLHPFFSNLLPEGQLRTYVAKGLNINEEREFFLLAALGADLPGAVKAIPDGQIAASADSIKDAAAKELDIEPLKFSLAGVQMKFSAHLQHNGRLTLRPYGEDGDHILKVPELAYEGLPEAEYATMKLSKLLGINTAEVSLVSTSEVANLPSDIKRMGGKTLSVKRFDRDGLKRIHMEDFAQVFGRYPADKYKGVAYHDIARVLRGTEGMSGVTEFIRRLVFMIGTGNADMHLKNWSLIYRDGVNPALSPAYDLVPTMAFHPSNELGLSLGGAKLITSITFENFAKLASKAELSSRQIVEIAKECSEEFLAAWTEHKHNLPFPPKVREQLESHIPQCEIFRWDKGVSGFGPSLNRALPVFLYAGLAGIAGDTESNNPEAVLYNLANKSYLEKDYNTSLKLFDSSIQTNPTALAYYNRGCAHALLNQLGEAAQDFAAADALGGLAEAAYNSSIMEIRLNDEITTIRPRIVSYLNAAVTRKPEMSRGWYNLGVYYLMHRATEAAVESFQRAIESEQSLTEAYFNLAITLFISGKTDEANHYFATAAAHDSKFADLQPKSSLLDPAHLTAIGAPGGPIGPGGNPLV